MTHRPAIILVAAIICANCAAPSSPPATAPGPDSKEPAVKLMVGEFSDGSLSDWEEESFGQDTTYELNRVGGRNALSARCEAAASGLYRHERVDLQKTPYLHWSWRVDEAYGQNIDELQKSGDDFPARVFVIVKGGLFGVGNRALNYVWSSSQEPGARWNSPYSERVKMLAVDAGSATGRWHVHRRNVRADLEQMYGLDIEAVDAVAVMTDCDDSQSQGVAHYGDIYFADE